MDEVECRLEVHVQHCIPLLLAHAQHQTVLGDTGVVDQHVDRTEILLYLLNHSLSLSKVGSITCVCLTLHSHRLDFLASSLQSGCHIVVEYEVCKCNVSSFLSKFHGNGLTDTTCSTCN